MPGLDALSQVVVSLEYYLEALGEHRSDASGILDALGYGDFSTAIFAGEGMAAMDVAAGWSLARVNPALDTDDNSVDFLGFDISTPGLAPASPVPVPAAAWLFLSGIAGLVGVSRRKS